ncbi:MAG: Carboxyltransferase domain, subdomain, partial [Actinomycetota bacterium]
MRLLPYGPRAVLAEFDTIDEVMASAAAWRTAAWPSVIDIVPAARTVLVVHDGSLD